MDAKHDPANIEAEESVLSSCLLSDEAARAAVELLSPDDFYRVAHQIVFNGIRRLVERDKPVDMLTIKEVLEKEGLLDVVGGPSMIVSLCDNTYSLCHVRAHIEMVLRTSMQRRLIFAARQIEAMAYSAQDDIDEVGSEAMRLISEAVVGSNARLVPWQAPAGTCV